MGDASAIQRMEVGNQWNATPRSADVLSVWNRLPVYGTKSPNSGIQEKKVQPIGKGASRCDRRSYYDGERTEEGKRSKANNGTVGLFDPMTLPH